MPKVLVLAMNVFLLLLMFAGALLSLPDLIVASLVCFVMFDLALAILFLIIKVLGLYD